MEVGEMLGYRVPAPDQAMLISGGKQKAEGGGQFKIVTGHGAWVLPGFRKVRFLSLETHKVEVAEKCYTKHGITVEVEAVVAFKVDNTPTAITAAAQRFLNDQKKGAMEDLTQKIFVGHLRGIIGRLTIEELIQEREKLTMEVLTGSQNEMSVMGLTVDSLQIEAFNDGGSNYIANMAKPQMAALEQAAKIAQAKADQASQAEQQKSLREQAREARDTEIANAQYAAETQAAAAEAAQAGPLATAEHQQKVIAMQSDLAQRNAELRQQQLVAEVIKPAEAAAEQARIQAQGQAAAAEANAERVKWEASAKANKDRQEAEAAADVARAKATADRDSALLAAEAIERQGEADATADLARGNAAAAAKKAYGLAEAAGEEAKAKAYAADEGAQLRMAEINNQPLIAEAIARGLGLNGANLTILDGPEGLTKTMATIAPMISMVAQMFGGQSAKPDTNGAPITETLQRVRAEEKAWDAITNQAVGATADGKI
jgi:flotillin